MFCLQKSSYKSSKWHNHNRTCCVWKESACVNSQKNKKNIFFHFSGEDHDEELNLILQQLGVKLSFTECITYLFSSKRTIKPFLILNSLFLLVRARCIFNFSQWIYTKRRRLTNHRSWKDNSSSSTIGLTFREVRHWLLLSWGKNDSTQGLVKGAKLFWLAGEMS